LAFIGQGQGLSARLGLAITKKKLKKAVDRNRLKRLCRENFRHRQASWVAIDVVVIVKAGYPREFDIATEVTELFNKINKLYSDELSV
ncbi:ribonuclease P protein component, partial [Moraxella catarrhalis]